MLTVEQIKLMPTSRVIGVDDKINIRYKLIKPNNINKQTCHYCSIFKKDENIVQAYHGMHVVGRWCIDCYVARKV